MPVIPPSSHSPYDTDASDQVVHSADHIALRLPVAGPSSRMLAYSIDAALILVIEVAIVVIVLSSTQLLWRLGDLMEPLLARVSRGEEMMQGDSSIMVVAAIVLLLFQFVAELVYFMIWDLAGGGRSLGKRVLNLQVVADGGLPLRWQESLVRNVLRLVDMLPSSYFVGLLAMLTLPDGKRLGDLAAGTIVVRLDTPQPALPLDDELDPNATAFRFDRAQLARLGDAERALIRQTLRRVETLPPEIASSVLEQAVGALRSRLGYEEVAAKDRRDFLKALLASLRR